MEEDQDLQEQDKGFSAIDKALADLEKKSKKTRKVREKSDKVNDDISSLYDPESLKPLLRSYADIRLFQTGRDHWDIPDREFDNPAKQAAISAQYFAPDLNPGYVSLVLFIFGMAKIYIPRIAKDVTIAQQEAKKEVKNE